MICELNTESINKFYEFIILWNVIIVFIQSMKHFMDNLSTTHEKDCRFLIGKTYIRYVQ